MMDFDIQVAHSVQEIGQEAWDRLGRGRPFASYGWYRFGEAVLVEDTPTYLVLSQGGRAVARATFWLKKQEPLPLPAGVARRAVQAMLRRWPLLVCRSPLSATSGLILPEPPLRDAALETVARFAQNLAQQYRVSFLIFDYLERCQTEWAGWPDAFVAASSPDPGTRLEIVWPDFESYLKHLGKSVRKDYRRQRNRVADLGVSVTWHQKATQVDEAMTLIRNVEQHHNSPPNPWTRQMLENLGLVDATWLQAEIEGRLIGCGLLIGDGGVRFLALLGLDYDVRYVYFHLFFTAIRCAVDQGVQVLRGGSGAYDLKQRLGFQPEHNNHVVFAGRGMLLQKVGRWAAGTV